MIKQKEKGYVLLLAVLISSIILAMSLGIFAISLKEVALATFARDSVKAFAASSRGLECAMFADRINRHAAFSSGNPLNFYDARVPITEYTPFIRGSDPTYSISPDGATFGETWNLTTPSFTCSGITPTVTTKNSTGLSSGITQFEMDFGDSCAIVDVKKNGIETTFLSNGYSDKCISTNPRRTQRTISVTVNI